MKGIKKIAKRALRHNVLNSFVRGLLRFCLQSSIIPFRQKIIIEDKVAWGIPVVNIEKFNIRCFDNKEMRMNGPISSPELRDLYWWGRYAFEKDCLLKRIRNDSKN